MATSINLGKQHIDPSIQLSQVKGIKRVHDHNWSNKSSMISEDTITEVKQRSFNQCDNTSNLLLHHMIQTIMR